MSHRPFFNLCMACLSLTLNPLWASKVALLNDTSAHYHWGCTATSTCLQEKITELGYELSLVSTQAIAACQDPPTAEEDFDSQDFFNSFTKRNSEIIRVLSHADLVVINGEGSLHDLNPKPRTLLYLAYIAKKFLHKHVEIINHSVYPYSAPFCSKEKALALYKKVYQAMDFIAIRETLSAQLIESLGIPITRSFDCLPLYLKRHSARLSSPRLEKKEALRSSKTILIAGSAAWLPEGMEAMAAFMQEMYKRGHPIAVLTGAKADPALDDQKMLHFLQAHAPNCWRHIDAQSLDEWFATIQNSALLISGRFHHSLAAAVLGTPFIALNSNTPKIQSLMHMLSLPPPLSYADPQLYEALLLRTAELLQNPAQATLSSERIEHLCELGEKNFTKLKELAL